VEEFRHAHLLQRIPDHSQEPVQTQHRFQRQDTKELRHQLTRERGEESVVGWLKYVFLLCSPMPGPPPPPEPELEVQPKSGKHRKGKKTATEVVEISAPPPPKKDDPFFNHFEKEAVDGPKGKSIATDRAGPMARELGYAPGDSDIQTLRAKAGDLTNYEEFYAFVASLPDDDVEEMYKSFAYYDPEGRGLIGEFAFRNMMESLGAKLSKNDVDLLTKKYSKDGLVNYRDLINDAMAVKKVPLPRF